MSLTFTDATANTKRMSFSNSNYAEMGSGTPSAPLSVNGVAFFNGSTLTQNRVPTNSIVRLTGSIAGANVASSYTVSTSGAINFGSVSNGGFIYEVTNNNFQIGASSGASSYSYSVF